MAVHGQRRLVISEPFFPSLSSPAELHNRNLMPQIVTIVMYHGVCVYT